MALLDDLGRMTITADLSICLVGRYVDDIFIMTKDKAAADKIFNKFNQQHSDIKFTIEVMFADHKATFISTTKKMLKRICFHIFVVVCLNVKKLYFSPMNIDHQESARANSHYIQRAQYSSLFVEKDHQQLSQ